MNLTELENNMNLQKRKVEIIVGDERNTVLTGIKKHNN